MNATDIAATILACAIPVVLLLALIEMGRRAPGSPPFSLSRSLSDEERRRRTATDLRFLAWINVLVALIVLVNLFAGAEFSTDTA